MSDTAELEVHRLVDKQHAYNIMYGITLKPYHTAQPAGVTIDGTCEEAAPVKLPSRPTD